MSRTETSGTESSGTETSGTESSGTETSETDSSRTESSGLKRAGLNRSGFHNAFHVACHLRLKFPTLAIVLADDDLGVLALPRRRISSDPLLLFLKLFEDLDARLLNLDCGLVFSLLTHKR